MFQNEMRRTNLAAENACKFVVTNVEQFAWIAFEIFFAHFTLIWKWEITQKKLKWTRLAWMIENLLTCIDSAWELYEEEASERAKSIDSFTVQQLNGQLCDFLAIGAFACNRHLFNSIQLLKFASTILRTEPLIEIGDVVDLFQTKFAQMHVADEFRFANGTTKEKRFASDAARDVA